MLQGGGVQTLSRGGISKDETEVRALIYMPLQCC
jgi:hypothetical protein